MECYMTRYKANGFNPPILISDTFNRSNGNLGIADTGQSWLTGGTATTAWVVNSNVAKRATATTSVNDVTYIDCGKSDVIISADITKTALSNASRIIARMSGTNTNNCMFMDINSAGQVYLGSLINGISNIFAQSKYPYTSGSTYSCRLECRGNIFTVYIDGVLKICSEDDNALKNNTRAGMFLACSSTSFDWFENFVLRG